MTAPVLVTGADGFVGRSLVAALRAGGENVLTHSIADGDIAHQPLSFSELRHVYHLAARTFVPDSWRSPFEFYETNVLGTANVLELCRRAGASVTVMSSYVYGQPRQEVISETHPLSAFNPYGHTKILAEEIGAYYAQAFGMRVSVVRPFNLYGPGQAGHFLIPSILRQATDTECAEITVLDDRPRRDYLYIDDLVSLLVRLLERGAQGAFNAGSGVSHSVREILDLVNQLIPKAKATRCTGESRPNEVLDMKADIGKAWSELGWKPAAGMREGLELTLRKQFAHPRID